MYLQAAIYVVVFMLGLAHCLRFRLPIYHPQSIYLLYFLFGYVLRQFVIIGTGGSQLWDYVGFNPSLTELYWACLVNCVCFLAFIFGPSFLVPHTLSVNAFPPYELKPRREAVFLLALLLMVSLGLFGLSGNFDNNLQNSTTLDYLADVDAQGGQRMVGQSGYKTAFAEFFPAAIIVSALVYGSNAVTLVLAFCFLVIKLWIGTAGRKSILVVMIGVYLICLSRRGARAPTVGVVVLAAVVGLLFDILGSNRTIVQSVFFGDTTFAQAIGEYVAARGGQAGLSDVSEFDVSALIYSIVPDKTGYNWFSQYLRILIWPIPRQIWLDKPVYTDFINLNQFGNFFGLTWSLHSDFYSNFGVLSAALLMLMLGCLLTWMHHRVVCFGSGFQVAWYWMLILYLPILYRDGPVAAAYFVLIGGLSMLLVAKTSNITRKASPTTPAGWLP